MKTLGCLFFFLFGIFILFFAVFGNIIRVLFGLRKAQKNFKKAAKQAEKEQRKQNHNYSDQQTSRPHKKQQNKGKIFDKNEGEYIDFEEVK